MYLSKKKKLDWGPSAMECIRLECLPVAPSILSRKKKKVKAAHQMADPVKKLTQSNRYSFNKLFLQESEKDTYFLVRNRMH